MAYTQSSMTLFPHIVMVTSLLTRAIDMTQDEIRPLFNHHHGLHFVLTLLGHYHEGWVRVFYASVWVDPDHQYIRCMFKGRDLQIE